MILISIKINAQNVIPNAGFEDWVFIDTTTELRPNYWRLDSSSIYISKGYGSPIKQSTNKRSGNYSLAIKGIIKDSICIGDTIRSTFLFKGRPKSLMGYFSFSKSTSALIYIQLILYAKDINSSIYKLSQNDTFLASNNSWSSFFLPIQYLDNNLSYKAEIKIYSPINSTLSDSNLIVYFDNFSFSNFNNIVNEQVNNLDIYPNPTSDFLYIKGIENKMNLIEISDVFGKVLKTFKTSEMRIDVSDLSIGCYIWTLNNDCCVYRGKFIKK